MMYPNGGTAHAYFGQPGPVFDTASDGILEGSATDQHLGIALGAGDVDGDGYWDAVVARPGSAVGLGMVTVLRGGPGSTIGLLQLGPIDSDVTDELFGAAVD
jgi:hypothetical protein